MKSIFDNLKVVAFNVVGNLMGGDALWYKDADITSPPVLAKVLYNDPVRDEKVSTHEYTFGRPTVEFKASDWVGIKDLADQKTTQVIYVNEQYYYVYKITSQNGSSSTSKDGDTYVAILEEAKDL